MDCWKPSGFHSQLAVLVDGAKREIGQVEWRKGKMELVGVGVQS